MFIKVQYDNIEGSLVDNYSGTKKSYLKAIYIFLCLLGFYINLYTFYSLKIIIKMTLNKAYWPNAHLLDTLMHYNILILYNITLL